VFFLFEKPLNIKNMKKIIIVILFFSFLSCSNKDASQHGDMAFITAQEEYVKPKMNFPNETEFDLLPVSNDFALKDSTYSICGKGSSKNAFGVKEPFVFKCKLKYLGGEESESSSWKLIGEVELTN